MCMWPLFANKVCKSLSALMWHAVYQKPTFHPRMNDWTTKAEHLMFWYFFCCYNQKNNQQQSWDKTNLPLIPVKQWIILNTINVFYERCSKWSAPQIFGTRRRPPPGSSSSGESECGTSSHGRSSGWVLPSPLGTAFSFLPRRKAEEKIYQYQNKE